MNSIPSSLNEYVGQLFSHNEFSKQVNKKKNKKINSTISHLCVVPTHSRCNTDICCIVIVNHLIVPSLHLSSVVDRACVHGKVLSNIVECVLLGGTQVIVLKHTLLCIGLSYSGQFIIPNLHRKKVLNLVHRSSTKPAGQSGYWAS